jgi:septal ring factor EnvC (AmiA/AmiB activator)
MSRIMIAFASILAMALTGCCSQCGILRQSFDPHQESAHKASEPMELAATVPHVAPLQEPGSAFPPLIEEPLTRNVIAEAGIRQQLESAYSHVEQLMADNERIRNERDSLEDEVLSIRSKEAKNAKLLKESATELAAARLELTTQRTELKRWQDELSVVRKELTSVSGMHDAEFKKVEGLLETMIQEQIEN